MKRGSRGRILCKIGTSAKGGKGPGGVVDVEEERVHILPQKRGGGGGGCFSLKEKKEKVF